MKIAIGSDHAGYAYKEEILKYLLNKNISVSDMGTKSEESCDYPDYAHPVANEIELENAQFGILICGSGNGVCMTANKHAGIRAALCWNIELAQLARQHNDANVLCIPSRFVGIEVANAIVEAFLTSSFEGGRHQNRVSKI